MDVSSHSIGSVGKLQTVAESDETQTTPTPSLSSEQRQKRRNDGAGSRGSKSSRGSRGSRDSIIESRQKLADIRKQREQMKATGDTTPTTNNNNNNNSSTRANSNQDKKNNSTKHRTSRPIPTTAISISTGTILGTSPAPDSEIGVNNLQFTTPTTDTPPPTTATSNRNKPNSGSTPNSSGRRKRNTPIRYNPPEEGDDEDESSSDDNGVHLFNIRGKAYLDAEGHGISSATVQLVDMNGTQKDTKSVQTDYDGNFRFMFLKKGAYLVKLINTKSVPMSITRDGPFHWMQLVDVWEGQGDFVNGVVLGVDYNLGGGSTAETLSFTPSMIFDDDDDEETSSLSLPDGNDDDDDGELSDAIDESEIERIVSGAIYASARTGTVGIGGAKVHLMNIVAAQNGGKGRKVKTNSEGKFVFNNVKLGAYIVRVEDNSVLPNATFLPRGLMKSKMVDLRNEPCDAKELVFGCTPSSGSLTPHYKVTRGDDNDDDQVGKESQQPGESAITTNNANRNNTRPVTPSFRNARKHKQISSPPKNFGNIPHNQSTNSLYGQSFGPNTENWDEVDVNDLLNSDSDMSFCDDTTTASVSRNNVSGVVYRDKEGRGVHGAEIHLHLVGSDGDSDNQIVFTRADGFFTCRGLKHGKYTVKVVETEALPDKADLPRDLLTDKSVTVWASGKISERVIFGFYDSSVPRTMTTTVAKTTALKTVTAKPTLDITRMTQERNLVLSNTNDSDGDGDYTDDEVDLSLLSGRVYENSNNEGVKRITVNLVDIVSAEPTKKSAETKADGSYSFDKLRPSTYVIRIAEMSLPGSSVQKRINLSTQKIITVCDGDDYLDVDFGKHCLPKDVYSILFFAKDQNKVNAAIAYIFVFAVFCVQISLLALMLIDIQYYSRGRWSWPPSLPQITIPVHASRFLVCLVAAVFQIDLITLTRVLFSGYGAAFPHRTSIRRIDNILFALVSSSRFGIKAIGLLISLIIVIQNDNIFDLISNFLAIVFVYHLHIIAFSLASSSNRGGLIGVWKEKALQTANHNYFKIGGRESILRRLEFIFILSAMPGMWGWTKFLELLNDNVLDLNRKVLSFTDDFSITPTEDHVRHQNNDSTAKEIMALMIEIQKGNRNLQDTQKGHKKRVEKLRDDVVSTLAIESNTNSKLLQSKIDSILAEKDSEIVQLQSTASRQIKSLQDSIKATHTKLRYVQKQQQEEVKTLKGEHLSVLNSVEKNHLRVLRDKTDSILAEKVMEMDELRSVSEEALRRGTTDSTKEIASLKDTIRSAEGRFSSVREKLQEQIDAAVAGKDMELEKLRSTSEAELQRLNSAFMKEVASSKDSTENNNKEMQMMRAKHESEGKKLQEQASLALVAALNDNSKLFEAKINLAVAEKKKQLKELRSALEEEIRQDKTASAKEMTALQDTINNVNTELQSMRNNHKKELKMLSSNIELRSFEERIKLFNTEKDKEVKELKLASEKILRQVESASKKEITSLQGEIANAHNEIEGVRAKDTNEMKMLQVKADKNFDNMTQLLQEKIDAVTREKDKELKEQKTIFSNEITLLEDTIQTTNTKVRTSQTEHKSIIERLHTETISALDKTAQENSRLCQGNIKHIIAEKKEELNKVRSASEEVMRQHQTASTKEMTVLQDTINIANTELNRMRADYKSEVKILHMGSDKKLRLLQEKIKLVVMEKDKEVEELRAASRQVTRQGDSTSKKEIAHLQDELVSAHDELKGVQVKHADEVKALNKKFSSTLTAASKESLRLLRDTTDFVQREKDKELKELRSASKDELRQGKSASTKELKALQDMIEIANREIQSMRVNHESEVKLLQKKSLSALKLLEEKIDAVKIEKDKELEEIKSFSKANLKSTIQKADKEMKTILVKHKGKINLLKEKNTSTDLDELKSICPTLFTQKIQGDKDVMLACKNVDSPTFPIALHGSSAIASTTSSPSAMIPMNNAPQGFVFGVLTIALLTSIGILVPFLRGYRVLLIPPFRRLIQKTPLVVNVVRSFLFKPMGGVIRLSSSWLKGYLPI